MNIKQFWASFEREERRLVTLDPDKIATELHNSLTDVNPGLGVEVARATDSINVVITAFGNRNLFSAAREIATAAPKLAGWTVIALKAPAGFAFRITVDSDPLDAGTIPFEPLRPSDGSEGLGCRIFLSHSLRESGDADRLAKLILLTGLGEEMFATLTKVEVYKLEEAPHDPLYLKDFLKFYDWWHRHALQP